MAESDRYQGSPLRRVLDAYVLDALGVLSAGAAQATRGSECEDKVRVHFGDR